MKLSVNKILIGLLFVFGVVLIPTSVVKADTLELFDGNRTFNITLDLRTRQTGIVENESIENVVKGDHVQASGNFPCATERCSYSYLKVKIDPFSSNPSGELYLFGVRGNPPPYGVGDLYGDADFTGYGREWNKAIFTGIVEGVQFTYEIPFYYDPDFTPSSATSPTVKVWAQNVDVPLSKKSNPLTVPQDTKVNISWNSENAKTCSCTYGSGLDCTPTGSGTGLNVQARGNPYILGESKTFTVSCND